MRPGTQRVTSLSASSLVANYEPYDTDPISPFALHVRKPCLAWGNDTVSVTISLGVCSRSGIAFCLDRRVVSHSDFASSLDVFSGPGFWDTALVFCRFLLRPLPSLCPLLSSGFPRVPALLCPTCSPWVSYILRI